VLVPAALADSLRRILDHRVLAEELDIVDRALDEDAS
jgi:hypothetical protein